MLHFCSVEVLKSAKSGGLTLLRYEICREKDAEKRVWRGAKKLLELPHHAFFALRSALQRRSYEHSKYAPVALKVHRGVVVVSRCCVCVAIAP